MNCIVVTRNHQEVNELKILMGQHITDASNGEITYNKVWIWAIVEDKLEAGVSGFSSLEHSMSVWPESPVWLFKTFKMILYERGKDNTSLNIEAFRMHYPRTSRESFSKDEHNDSQE